MCDHSQCPPPQVKYDSWVTAGSEGTKSMETAKSEYIALICTLSNTPLEDAAASASDEQLFPLGQLSRAFSGGDANPNLSHSPRNANSGYKSPTAGEVFGDSSKESTPATPTSKSSTVGKHFGSETKANLASSLNKDPSALNNITPQQLLDDLRFALNAARLSTGAYAHSTEQDLRLRVTEAIAAASADLKDLPQSAKKRLEDVGGRVGFSFRFFSWDYLSRLLFVLCCLVFTGYLNALSSNLAGYRNPQIKIVGPAWAKGTTTLPDIGHEIVSHFTQQFLGTAYIDWFELPDHFVDFMGAIMMIFIVLHPKRFMIIRRLCMIFATLNLLRSFTVIVTSLPDASPECAKQFADKSKGGYKDSTLEQALGASMRRAFLLIIQPGAHITCGDMVFSGHTCFITLAMCVFVTYCRGIGRPRVCALIRAFVVLVWAVGCIAIVGTKLHYTLDVFLAIFLTCTVWRVYHHAIEFDKLKSQYRVLQWLENEVILDIDQGAFQEYKRKRD